MVKIDKTDDNTYTFQADDIDIEYLRSPDFKKMSARIRGSIMLIGPLLARFGKGYISTPGGDKIGRRRLDTHFIGFENLGAVFEHNNKEDLYSVTAKKLRGAYMLLDEASVTGTANIVMAATMACQNTVVLVRRPPASVAFRSTPFERHSRIPNQIK